MSDHIPFEIQVEIIKNLPTKSVIQCRCVSKSWKSFIDSPSFIAGYSARSRAQPQHLFVRYQNMPHEEDNYVSIADDNTFPHNKCTLTVPPSVSRLKDSYVLGTSRGLVCLFGYYRNKDDLQSFSGTDVAVIWNPSIRKSVAIDMPSRGDGTDFGFGVCPVTSDPKIVYIHDTHKKLKGVSVSCSSRWQVEVFTLSSGVWRTSYGNLPGNSVEFGCGDPPATIDGSVNWLVGNVIISFDLSSEEFKEIRFSNELYTDYLFLLKLNDSLALVSMNLRREDICKVWMMENGDSGTFINRFTFKPYRSVDKLCIPLEFRRNGELVMQMIHWLHDSAVVVACTPYSEQLNEVGIKGWSTTVSVSPYTESLLLLDR